MIKRLTTFKLRAAVDIGNADPPLAMAVAWGADSFRHLGMDGKEGATGKPSFLKVSFAFTDPRLSTLGLRLLYPADQPIAAALERRGFAIATETDYATHQLALGVVDSAELGGEYLYPLEANFEPLHGVDFKKGCYVGQELTARMKLKGNLRKRVLPVRSATTLPATGSRVMANERELGTLIAVSGCSGLALLRLDRLESAAAETIKAQDVALDILRQDWLPE